MMTTDDLIPLRNKFFDGKGDVVEATVSDDDVFLITAGPWPNPNLGARQVRCECCKKFAGLSAKGYELAQRNKLRTIVCSECFVIVHNLKEALEGK